VKRTNEKKKFDPVTYIKVIDAGWKKGNKKTNITVSPHARAQQRKATTKTKE